MSNVQLSNEVTNNYPRLVVFLPRMQALSTPIQSLILTRLRIPGARTSRRCSYCRDVGHTIGKCCHPTGIAKILEVCELIPYSTHNELIGHLHRESIKTLTLFCNFIHCAHTPSKTETVMNIADKMIPQRFSPRTQNPPPAPAPTAQLRPAAAATTTTTTTQPDWRHNLRTAPSYAEQIAIAEQAYHRLIETVRRPVNPITRIEMPFNEVDVSPVDHLMTEGDEFCPICYESLDSKHVIATHCNHMFCIDCTKSHFNHVGKKCPICRADVTSVTASSYECYFNFVNRYLSVMF